jgi:Fic family protein
MAKKKSAKKATPKTQVDSLRHKDKRKNIPTEELRDFVAAEEQKPKTSLAEKEAAWSSLYSTASRPIDKPESGKIAVKVINHYGDEVMKVFDV